MGALCGIHIATEQKLYINKEEICFLKLGDICEIRAGYPFREKIMYSSYGEDYVIQLKDVSLQNGIDEASLLRVNLEGKKEKHLLNKNDILFVNKGTKIQAYALNQNFKNTVASSHFFVITVRDKEILPEYVAWYLNSLYGQKYIKRNSVGSSLPHINKSLLSEMPLSIPDIRTQKIIIELNKSFLKEHILFERLLSMKKQYHKLLLDNLMSKNGGDYDNKN